MKPTTFHPDADAEVTEAAEYYESRSLGLGSELLGEVEKALGQISTNPAWRDWSRRAFGPQLSREHVRLHKIILDYG